MDRGHDVRPGEADQVGVAAQVTRVVTEPLAPEVGLGQLVRLDERAHPAVEHEDPFAEQAVEGASRVDRLNGEDVVDGRGTGHGSEPVG